MPYLSAEMLAVGLSFLSSGFSSKNIFSYMTLVFMSRFKCIFYVNITLKLGTEKLVVEINFLILQVS